MNIGLCWAGGPLHRNDVNRSSPFEAWRPVLAVPGCTFHSLLPADHARADDWKQHEWAAGMLTPIKAKADFYATTPVVARMDLCITVDTAIGHLAGGMNRPVWLLLATSPDFRWGLGTDATPWYPHHTLYRQTRAGEWAGVLEQVARDLAAVVAGERTLRGAA